MPSLRSPAPATGTPAPEWPGLVTQAVNPNTDSTVLDTLDFVRQVTYPYFPGAIFPSEMAYFLDVCQAQGIRTIIESGRENGYSTAIAAEYGANRGVRIISIDTDWNPTVSRRTEERLSRYPQLELIKGDSFYHLPATLRGVRSPVALLIDGPKAHAAVYLSAAAAAWGKVRVIAHHNTPPGSAWHDHFAARFHEARRLEDSTIFHRPEFAGFRSWEREVTRETSRDLDNSSLVACALPANGRNWLKGPSARHTAASWAVYLWWAAGRPRIRNSHVMLWRWYRARQRIQARLPFGPPAPDADPVQGQKAR